MSEGQRRWQVAGSLGVIALCGTTALLVAGHRHAPAGEAATKAGEVIPGERGEAPPAAPTPNSAGQWQFIALGPKGLWPSFSPDGALLAYVAPVDLGAPWDSPPHKHAVMLLDLGTGKTRRLARGTRPAWSHDGTRIAYFDDRAEALALVSGVQDFVRGGEAPAAVLMAREVNGWFDWSPDDRELVYSTARGRSGGLRAVTVPGGGDRLIASGPFEGGEPAGPAWSPDGKWIAFAARRSSKPSDQSEDQLLIVRPDGSGLRPLAAIERESWRAVVGGGGANPRWCIQAGRWYVLAYSDSDMLRVDPVSAKVDRLRQYGPPRWPAWEPGGRRLASVCEADPARIVVAGGWSDRWLRLADVPSWRYALPLAWHPKGERLAFTDCDGRLALAIAPGAVLGHVHVASRYVSRTYPQGTGSITGQVTDVDGRPLRDLWLSAWNSPEGDLLPPGSAKTGADGCYTIEPRREGSGLAAPRSYLLQPSATGLPLGFAEVSPGQTTTVNFRIDTVSPTVRIESPADGDTVSGTVPAVLSASDNVAVSTVGFDMDGSEGPVEGPGHKPWYPFGLLGLSDDFDDTRYPPLGEWLNSPAPYDVGETRSGWLHVVADQKVDFSATEDSGHLLWHEFSGDFVVETRLSARPDTDHQMAGLMVREGRGRWDLVVYRHDSQNRVQVLRKEGGEVATLRSVDLQADPLYLKLERRGDELTSWYSTDDRTWTPHHQWTHHLTDPVKVGLAVASGSATDFVVQFDYLHCPRIVRLALPCDTKAGDRLPGDTKAGEGPGPHTAAVANGKHVLRGQVSDLCGNSAEAQITVNVQN